MEITIISDTHGRHHELTGDLIGGDVLIHCGDSMTSGYKEEQLISFCEWFDKLDLYVHKIFIAGNHCRLFENNSKRALEIVSNYKNIIYLQDSGVKIGKTFFYGTPWQPEFYNWAFNLPRKGGELFEKWQNIPEKTDILITHCPPFGYLDSVRGRGGLGCELLRDRVDTFKNLINCFGHIHDSYGIIKKDSNTFINASSLNEEYTYQNKPINLRYNSKSKVATPVKDLRGIRYCEANKDIIFKEYFTDNNSIPNIAKKYKIKIDCLRKIIRDNWRIKGISEAKQKYSIDLTMFEKIDKNWKAYFLGWMYSDGNVYRGAGKNTASLCIAETDKYILEYFNDKIYNGEKPLNYRPAKIKKGTNYMCKPLSRFQIDSSKICDDLVKTGLVENKSLIKIYPNLEKNLNSHFIRGYFEGNGSIKVNRVEPNRVVTIVSGSEVFLEKLSEILYAEIGVSSKIKRVNNNLWILSFSKKEDVLKFYNYIYFDCEMSLNRKRDNFINKRKNGDNHIK